MNKSLLCKPFEAEQLRTRPGRNGQVLSYVETHAVISRLNEACDAWSLRIVEHSVHADEVVVLVELAADGVVKSAFGGSSITMDSQGRVISLADDLKSAASDALKKAASLLGVGLELYGGQPVQAQRANDGDVTSKAQSPVVTDVSMQNRISAKQLAWLHGMCRRLGYAREDLLGMVRERTGKQKLELLSKSEASALIDHFQSSAPAA